jgi:hypothetical protein
VRTFISMLIIVQIDNSKQNEIDKCINYMLSKTKVVSKKNPGTLIPEPDLNLPPNQEDQNMQIIRPDNPFFFSLQAAAFPRFGITRLTK